MDANKDNVYEVTVQASDGANTSMKAVTVKVTNRQENGKVEVTPEQGRIGVELTAALTDSDVVAYGPMWQWQRRNMVADCIATRWRFPMTTPTTLWMNIRGATSATYTAHSDDLNYCLRAVVTYNDGYHQGAAADGIYADATSDRFDKTAEMILSKVQYPSNNLAPRFGSAMTKRFVPEGIAANNPVGKPVTAFDPNGKNDLAGYSLSGTDADSFDLDAGSGQLTTGKKFNHEMKDKYTVMVTATDTHDATDDIKVEIYVVDVDEKSPIVAADAPATTGPSTAVPSITGRSTVTYRENGTADVGTYSVRGAAPTWALSGTDRRAFTISAGGVVTFVNTPNYETKTRYTFSVDATVDGEDRDAQRHRQRDQRGRGWRS